MLGVLGLTQELRRLQFFAAAAAAAACQRVGKTEGQVSRGVAPPVWRKFIYSLHLRLLRRPSPSSSRSMVVVLVFYCSSCCLEMHKTCRVTFCLSCGY